MTRNRVAVRIDADLYDELYDRAGSEQAVEEAIEEAVHRLLVTETDDDVDWPRDRNDDASGSIWDDSTEDDEGTPYEYVDDCSI